MCAKLTEALSLGSLGEYTYLVELVGGIFDPVHSVAQRVGVVGCFVVVIILACFG